MTMIEIDDNKLLDLLMDRVAYWTSDSDVLKLFKIYYTGLIVCGAFEGCKFDLSIQVDNDYLNYYGVINKDDSDYDWAIENNDRIVARLDDDKDTMLVYMA